MEAFELPPQTVLNGASTGSLSVLQRQRFLELWFTIITKLFFSGFFCFLLLSETYFKKKHILSPNQSKTFLQFTADNYLFQCAKSCHLTLLSLSETYQL